MSLKTKSYPIEKDYVLTDKILGTGADGNIILIQNKTSGEDYVLKVS